MMTTMGSNSPSPRPEPIGFDELAAIAADPVRLAAFRARIVEEAARANPNLTREQIEAQWPLAEMMFF